MLKQKGREGEEKREGEEGGRKKGGRGKKRGREGEEKREGKEKRKVSLISFIKRVCQKRGGAKKDGKILSISIILTKRHPPPRPQHELFHPILTINHRIITPHTHLPPPLPFAYYSLMG